MELKQFLKETMLRDMCSCPKPELCDHKNCGKALEYYNFVYPQKAETIKKFNPKKYCEIGVMNGWSAGTFMSVCPDLHYTGIDSYEWPAARKMIGPNSTPQAMYDFITLRFMSYFKPERFNLYLLNSQRLTILPGAPFDLVYVDGDHSLIGCYNDLCLAFNSIKKNGIIWCDDYANKHGVPRAINKFTGENQEFIKKAYPLPPRDFVLEINK